MMFKPLLHTFLRSITTGTWTALDSSLSHWITWWEIFGIVLHCMLLKKSWLWLPRTKNAIISFIVTFKTWWGCWTFFWMKTWGLHGEKHRWSLQSHIATMSHVCDWCGAGSFTSSRLINFPTPNTAGLTQLFCMMKISHKRFKPSWEKEWSKNQSRWLVVWGSVAPCESNW